MKITPRLFEAHLKCPTKCWLRANGETPTGNTYAEWVMAQNESYRVAQTERLLAETQPGESARSPSAENLKASKWRLAVDAVAQASSPASSGSVSLPGATLGGTPGELADETSALQSRLHAIERVPAEGRGKAAQFIPIRFIFRNKLTKDDKLLLAFDAFVLSAALGRDITTGKIIHGDTCGCARESVAETSRSVSTLQGVTPSEHAKAWTPNAGDPHGTGINTISQTCPERAADCQDLPADQQPGVTTAAFSRTRPQAMVTKVKTSTLAGEVRKRLEKIAALLATTRSADSLVRESQSNEETRGLGGPRSGPPPPDLVLNRHCAECEFQARCRKIAVEKDDLSLLANMSAKERQKLRGKGIFTVTQLSYTFRPRRRPKRLRDKREKYHHSLKALAIREKKIHIVGSPELKIEGTPVYLDVEGLPDRDFYYLIGLRIGNGEAAVQHSLWADTVADEGKIWREFLAILETVEKPVLIHYGSYETTFLDRMKERTGTPPKDSVAAKLIGSAVNLVLVMYSKMYFPTFTNGLKEIAGWLGFKWSESSPSGTQAICWRSTWEQCRTSTARENLVLYNAEDCKALDALATKLTTVGQESATRPDVDHIDKAKTPVTERGKELSRSLARVLKSAHADYATRKISLHGGIVEANSNTAGPRPREKSPLRRLRTRGRRTIRVPRKRTCQRHADHPTVLRTVIRKTQKDTEHTLLDLEFTGKGCKTTVVRYIGRWAFCPYCHGMYPPPAIKRMRGQFFGRGFHVWAIYLRVALRLSVRLIAKVTRDFFNEDFSVETLRECIERTSDGYADTEKLLIRELLQSPSIHIDETKVSILGTQQYVWVMTDGRHVAFRLTPSRETAFLQEVLNGYEGTIVTDFYGGYDALPCRQQKCLVHLIRDMNDDLWKNPFDEEYELFVAAVRELLVPLLEDVQRFGLRTFHLRKHKNRVDRFYKSAIENRPPVQELTAKYQKRFERYKSSMFAFLDYDGVSWNNNAAERAIRHLAVQRKISGAFSTTGADHYLRLLAIAQTCRFQEKSFLGFLLSELKSVDAYKEKRRQRGLNRDE